jgi:6-phosphogluconolactonase (cycloisomerase 2 family)
LTQTSYVSGNHGGFGIVANPAGTRLYTDDLVADGIDGFSIGSSGILSPISGSPFSMPTGWAPLDVDSLAVDPTGSFLYAPDATSNTVVGFTIDNASGALAAIPGSPFPTGIGPVQTVVHPSGSFLYVSVANDPTGGISGFAITPSTGALTPIAGSPFPSQGGPDGLVIDASGKFLFAVLPLVSEIAAYTIDSGTGVLTPVSGSPFNLGGAGNFVISWSIALAPSGQFLYALGSGDAMVYSFGVDPSSGALAPLSGSPFDISVEPFMSGLLVDPSGKFLYVGIETGSMTTLNVDESTGALSPNSASSIIAYAPTMAIIKSH